MNRQHIAICMLGSTLFHLFWSLNRVQAREPVWEEKYEILTDRSIYIAGETIRFRVFHRSHDTPVSDRRNDVLHVELIAPSGFSLAGKKIGIDRRGGTGCVIIPRDISSGTYYLKAYSRWMRNCGPESFSYLSVQIIDPFRESVLEVDTTGNFTAVPGLPVSDRDPGTEGMMRCLLPQDRFGSREKVRVTLAWDDPARGALLCASVSRTGTHPAQYVSNPGCRIGQDDRVEFIPESRGVALTGTVVNRDKGEPVPYAVIYISILEGDRNFFCNYSDSAGRFYFAFPGYKGRQDLFISVHHREYEDMELLIDQDFSNGNIRLPSFPILLNDSIRRLAAELSMHAQVAQQYAPYTGSAARDDGNADSAAGNAGLESGPTGPAFFYGRPSATIRFDDFIRLPTLEEYFTEVIPQVALRRNAGNRELRVLGDHPDLNIYPPLVMIDGVAIFDMESLLEVSPRLVERTEVVTAPYVRGDVTFGGIINVITRENNLGYIDLPSSGLLVDYQMLAGPDPGPETLPPQDPRLPDVRNTLYFGPSIELSPGEETGFSFYTSDVQGSYEILIRGFDDSGNPLEKRVPFTVE
ncbi:MAG: hypothetical protein R6U78_09290 [Bacteroidales bacterium]